MDFPVDLYFFWLFGVLGASYGILVPLQTRHWSPSRLQVNAYWVGMVLGALLLVHLLFLNYHLFSSLNWLHKFQHQHNQVLSGLSLMGSIALLYPVWLSCFVQRLLARPTSKGSVA